MGVTGIAKKARNSRVPGLLGYYEVSRGWGSGG